MLDNREFIELYNKGASAVDISDWSIVTTSTGTITDTLPAGSMIPAGGYFVIAAANRGIPANLINFPITIAAGEELYPDGAEILFELKDNSSTTVDAVAMEAFRNTVSLVPDQTAGGIWGQDTSTNAAARLSTSRWMDGLDSNNNGHDFGRIPATPGASNNVTSVAAHVVPNVDALAAGTVLPQYNFSYVGARVIDPAVASTTLNPKVISPSPQGGKAIVAWDHTGGGNAVYSKELVKSFDLWAYIDPVKIGVAPTSADDEWENYTYGIGTTNELYNSHDTPGTNAGTGVPTSSGNTGIGWVYEKYEEPTGVNDYTTLSLVDFNDGGDSKPDADDWNVVTSIDISALAAGWHRLSISYDPATGAATGKYDDQSFPFNAGTDLVGTFYAGYREAITGAVADNITKHSPPIFDSIAMTVNDADFDNDLDIDGADFLTWQKSAGGAGGPSAGDANGDGQVNDADLAIWKDQFGKPVVATPIAGAVPEPGAMALAITAITALAAQRGRGRRRLT